jgi:hypothetical protein
MDVLLGLIPVVQFEQSLSWLVNVLCPRVCLMISIVYHGRLVDKRKPFLVYSSIRRRSGLWRKQCVSAKAGLYTEIKYII